MSAGLSKNPAGSNDAQVLEAFFHTFRLQEETANVEMLTFFQAFDHSYQLARSTRASNTPHLDVLGVFGLEFKELRHSDALAWFLRPRSSHEQGHLFADALVRHLGLASLADENYEVLRERHDRTDVAVYSAGRFCVFIENKVRHSESDKQVIGMIESMSKLSDRLAIPREHRCAVFLTDSGAEPVSGPSQDSPGFLLANLFPLRRVDLFELFLGVLEKRPVYSPLLLGFLNAYLNSVRRLRAQIA